MINFRFLNDLLDSPLYSSLATGAHRVIKMEIDRERKSEREREWEWE